MTDKFSAMRRDRAEEILTAIPKYNGNVSAICQGIDIARSTFYRYRNDFPEIAEALDEVRADLGDRLEHKLYELALDGNLGAIIFALKTQYGWRETNRLEIDADVRNSHLIEEKSERWDRILREWKAEAIEGEVVVPELGPGDD